MSRGDDYRRAALSRYYAEERARLRPKLDSNPAPKARPDPATMPAAAINRELSAIMGKLSVLNADFIAAGLGHVRYQDLMRLDHPLAERHRELDARRNALVREIERRAGPGMRELPRGFGPLKNPVPASRVKRAQALGLAFSGHHPELRQRLDAARALGLPIQPGAKIPLFAFGELMGVEYRTIRDGAEEFYRHRFRKSSRPLLAARHDGSRIYIVGGRYRFTDRGIVDK